MMASSPPREPSPWIAVALLSAAALSYEVLLTRLFAIVYWHHLAHMIISLALLGYGASGTFLSFCGKRLKDRFGKSFTMNAAAFALSAPLCFAAAQSLPFNPLELAWAPVQWLWLAAIYLVLSLPFFAAANAIALALWQDPVRLHRVYAADLVGAGVGALGIVLLLFVLTPSQGLRAASTLGFVAAAVAVVQTKHDLRWAAGGMAMAVMAWLVPGHWIEPMPSLFKDLPQRLQTAGATVITTRSNPLAEITIVDNREVPFRFAPGMSLSMGRQPPRQLAVFQDGSLIGPVTLAPEDRSKLDYLDALPSALPYHLREAVGGAAPKVLILAGGNGEGIRQALHLGASRVEATEHNPAMAELMRNELAAFNGSLFDLPQVLLHTDSIREFSASSKERFDLIQLDAGGASAAGLDALNEKRELTVEAIESYLRLLSTGGLLTVTHGLTSPPRVLPRLLFTAISALESVGLDPEASLVVIRSWRTATLVLKTGAFTAKELSRLGEFCDQRSFDIDYAPGLEREETNRYNVLPQPYLFDAARALMDGTERQHFIDTYKFEVEPVTDDKPFLYHTLRWSSLPELVRHAAAGTAAQLEWGYLTLVATLFQAAVLSFLLILVPTLIARNGARSLSKPSMTGVIVYFAVVGLAFLFVEIAFVHSLQRLLHHPIFAVSAVLAGFLIFAGIGSRYSQTITRRFGRLGLWPIATAIFVAALVPTLLLPGIASASADWPLWTRFVLALALVAPLSFLMGMPFPLGLARVTDDSTREASLAWAVNGCASVVGAIGAELTALAAGFTATAAVGGMLYLAAAFSLPLLGKPRVS